MNAPARRALKVVPEQVKPLEALMTSAEVGALLKRSPDAVRMMVARGQLPGYRIGEKGLRFKRKDIADYLEKLPQV